MKKTFNKNWQHLEIESKLYNNWEQSGYFKPEISQKLSAGSDQLSANKPFVIAIPPPNVTGKLHIGHAYGTTLQDLMIRYHRLLGDASLYIPGMDHAGIATQAVVDKKLRKEGINKNDIGREKFVEEVWKWKEESGGKILQQLRAIGASCDWDRERFTLDAGLSDAVRQAFIHLYEKDLIYRGLRTVNWCPKCHTAIADDEVEYKKEIGKFYWIKYGPFILATSRPETKLGDTAVAVHPGDKRYKDMVGKKYMIPGVLGDFEVEVVADNAVDPNFGSGAVKVTPAHSIIDFEISQRHNIPIKQVIDDRGRMMENSGKYAGMTTKEAREEIVADMMKLGLIDHVDENYEHNIAVCYRCGGQIEPIPSKQWFVKMKPLAEKARQAVESGEIEIIPKRFEKVYFHWLDNIRDWCVSRQLWWGHQIPVWYSDSELSEEKIYVGENPPEGYIQDEDVLDTWFSSALWPFSTLGWPNGSSEDYQRFYPTTVMETGYDILFFWVARMIMMGQELTGKIPFKTVYLHGLVRDEHNRKMSKSLGNALDPLDLIAKYGTDALRMGLIIGSTPGQDVAIGESKIRGYRNFTNKIWNASRFVSLRVTDGDLQSGEQGESKISDLNIDEKLLTKDDREILVLYKTAKDQVTKHLNKFEFSLAGESLYNFFWHTFCDQYIEKSKLQLDDEKIKDNTKKILIKILSESLIMLHPFAPFVTEAVWQELREFTPNLAESIMISTWPK